MGLFELPAELRNNIYHLVLAHEQVIDIEPRSLLHKAALTQTCSEIRKDTLAIFLASNTFRITPTSSNMPAMAKWIRGLGAHANLVRRLIFKRHVILDEPCGCEHGLQCPPWHKEAYSQSVRCPRLHTLARQQSPALMVALGEAVKAGLSIHALEVPWGACPRTTDTFDEFSVAVCALLETWLQHQLGKRGLDTGHLMAGYAGRKEQRPLPLGRPSSSFLYRDGQGRWTTGG